MSEPSLTDYDSSDFSCIEAYEHWVITNFARLETEAATAQGRIEELETDVSELKHTLERNNVQY